MTTTSHPSWLRRLSERLLGRPKAKRKQARRNTAPLAVERLEDRTLLTGTWTGLANPVPSQNGIGTMLLLSDGSVMVNGGGPGGSVSGAGGNISSDWYKLTPDNTGNYADGTWTKLASMNVQRLFYTSDVLPDGRVLVVGGEYSNVGDETNTGEIYDPTTNTWTNIPNVTTVANPITTFGDGPSEVLADGTVLFGYNGGSQTYIYNPKTNTWSDGPALLHGDTSAEEGWVKLADGSILTYSIQGSQPQHGQRFIMGATPAQDKWVDAGSVPVALDSNGGNGGIVPENGPPVLLPDGRVFYIGASGHTALYTPGTNSWAQGPDIPNPDGNPNGYGAFDAPAAILPNGKVLTADSPIDGNNFPGPTYIFQYDPATNAFTQVPATTGLDLSGPAFEDRFLMLPNGQALFSNSTDDLFAYTPDSPQVAAGEATVSSIVRSGGNFTLTGTQLNGISEGATYGDDAEMASNYPILSFTDGLGGVAYGRTFNWSSVGVQTGATPVTTQFSLPASDGTGAYLVNVDANGLINAGTLLLDMGNGFNNVTIRIDPTTLEVQTLENGNPTGLFPRGSFTSIIVVGGATNDTLSLDFSNGNFIPSGGLNFDGMTGNNTLNLLGFSPFTNEVVTPTSAGAGSVVFDGSTTITFANAKTLDDTTGISGKVTYNGRLGGQTINVTNFGPLNGVQATQIASSVAAFPTIAFSQKPNVLFQGAVGGDTFNLNDSIRAKGLNTQTFAAGPAAGNSFNIPSTPAGVVTNVVGGAAGDTVTVSSAGSVQAIAGTLNIENTGGRNALLVLDDSADAGARTVTLSSFTPNTSDFEGDNDVWGKVSGLAPADINYEFPDSTGLTINGGGQGDTFIVNATNPNQITTINGGAGADSFTVNGVGVGSTDDLNGLGGNDAFAVTAALPAGAALNIDGGTGTNTLTGTNLGDAFNVNATNSGNDVGVVTLFANIQDLIGGTGADTFNVTAGGVATISSAAGNDTFNLSGGSITSVTGGSGNDTFNLSGATVGSAAGGSGNDTFNLSGGSVSTVDGGAGDNTLTGPNSANTWNITGANSGSLNGTTAFTNIENLTGGSGADTFTFGAGGSLLGTIDGGGLLPGPDSLNISAVAGAGFNVTGPGTAHGYAGAATVLGGFNNIDAFTGSDTLIGGNSNNVWTITGPGSGTLVENGTFTYTFSGIANLVGGSMNDQFIIAGGSVSTIDGGGGNNTLTGDATANVWDVTGVNSGTLNTIAFKNIANLVGGPLTDQFNIQGGVVSTIDGGAGVNTLTGDNVANTWDVTGADSGTLNTIAFKNIANLVGGSQADQFNIQGGVVSTIDGGAGANTLAGPNTAEVWNVTGPNAGNLPGLVPLFVNIQNLVGGTGDDDFVFSKGATLSGGVDGGAGNDTLNVSAYTTATNAALTGLGPIDGYAGNVTGITGFTDLETLIGGPTAGATLTGLNGPATWAIGGAGSYTINGSGRNFAFSGITNLTGGTGADDFVFAAGATFAGAIDGGGGTNTLDFSAYTTAVNVTLTGLGATDGFAGTPAIITGGFTDIGDIIGSATATPQTLTGANLAAVWGLAGGGTGTYTAGGNTLAFSNYQNVVGGPQNDNFEIATGATVGAIDGGGGVNTLTGPNQNATWNVTGPNAGNISGVVASFVNIQDITGGSANDDFIFSNGATVAVVDGGAGFATLDLSHYATAQNVALIGGGGTDGFAGTVAALTGDFTNINTLIGSATATPQTLTGANLPAVWTIGVGGTDTYTVGPDILVFSNYQALTGGANTDDFIVETGATFGGVIDGGGGNNTLTGPNQNDVWDLGPNGSGDIRGVVASFLHMDDLVGGSGNDDFVVAAGAGALPGVIDGGGGDNTLTGPNQNEVWGVTGPNAGYLEGEVSSFHNIQNLIGGSGNDVFVFAAGGYVVGVIDGGGGTNGLSFSTEPAAQDVALTGLGATDGFAGVAAGAGVFTNIDGLAGSAGSLLVGLNVSSLWYVSSIGGYAAAGRILSFTSFGTVYGGSANDVFVVLGVSAPTVLNGGGGGDVFDVENPAAVTAPLIVNQGAQLTVDDSAGGAAVASITESSVGSTPGDTLLGPGGTLHYYNMGALTFLGGPFGNTINVFATVLGAPLTVEAGAGNNVVNVYVNPYVGYSNVLIDGQGGANGMQVIDETGGGVVRNLPTGPGAGFVTADYSEGVRSVVQYVNMAAVVTSETPDQDYVEAVYHQFLHRDATPSDVAYWAAYLDATGNRAAFVDSIVQSPEARDVLVKQWYVDYLGRPAQGGEEMPLVNELVEGQSEETVLSGLLGSGEFYARGGGTEAGFVQELFLATLGRPASATDVANYEQTIGPRSGPAGEAFAVLGSAEFRGNFVYVLYADELERLERGAGAPSPEDVQGWVFSGLSMTGLREVFAETDEFYDNAS